MLSTFDRNSVILKYLADSMVYLMVMMVVLFVVMGVLEMRCNKDLFHTDTVDNHAVIDVRCYSYKLVQILVQHNSNS